MPKQLLLPLTFDAAACLLLLQKKTVMVDCSSKQASLPFFYYTYYIQGGEERQCSVYSLRETVPNFNFPHIKVALATAKVKLFENGSQGILFCKSFSATRTDSSQSENSIKSSCSQTETPKETPLLKARERSEELMIRCKFFPPPRF